MAELRLQSRLNEILSTEFSFSVVGKQLRGIRGEVEMTVWLNPENRLKRVRTISIDCARPGDGENVYYQYGLSYASRGWGGCYEPTEKGWPEVILADFKKWAVPFIRDAVEPARIIEMILAGDIPPSEGTGGMHGRIMSALRIASTAGNAQEYESIRTYLMNVSMSRSVARGLMMQPLFQDLKMKPNVRWIGVSRQGDYVPSRSRLIT